MTVMPGLNAPDKDQIISTIEAYLAQTTLEDLSIANVAKDLNVSPRYIFKRFRTKLEMADAVAARHVATLADLINTQTACGRPGEKLETLLRILTGSMARMEPTRSAALAIAASRERRALVVFKNQLVSRIEEILVEGQRWQEFKPFDPKITALTIFDLLAAIADPRVIEALPAAELRLKSERIISFIIASVANA